MKSIHSIFILVLAGSIFAFNVSAQEEDVPKRSLDDDFFTKIVETSLLQEKVLNYQIKKHGVDSIETLRPVEALAWIYMEMGNYNESEVLYRKAIQIRQEKMPPSDENTEYIGIAYFMLGEISLLRKRYLRAEDNYDMSLKLAVDPSQKGDVLSRKGKLYKQIGNYDKALSYYLRSVEGYESADQSKRIRQRIMDTYVSLSEVYKNLGLRLKAKEYLNMVDEMKEEYDDR